MEFIPIRSKFDYFCFYTKLIHTYQDPSVYGSDTEMTLFLRKCLSIMLVTDLPSWMNFGRYSADYFRSVKEFVIIESTFIHDDKVAAEIIEMFSKLPIEFKSSLEFHKLDNKYWITYSEK